MSRIQHHRPPNRLRQAAAVGLYGLAMATATAGLIGWTSGGPATDAAHYEAVSARATEQALTAATTGHHPELSVPSPLPPG